MDCINSNDGKEAFVTIVNKIKNSTSHNINENGSPVFHVNDQEEVKVVQYFMQPHLNNLLLR